MSATEIAKALKKWDPQIFAAISHQTINEWIDCSGERPKWKDHTLERVRFDPQYNAAGHLGILVSDCWMIFLLIATVFEVIKAWLCELRSASAPVTVITARAIILEIISKTAPEILEHTSHDGSQFRASESFVHKGLHETMKWSIQKATRTAHKLPRDWEDQSEHSTLQKAYTIKEHNIVAELWVNSDQGNNNFSPGTKMTWMEHGKQVSLIGGDKKRAFTLMVSVSASGELLLLIGMLGVVVHTSGTVNETEGPNCDLKQLEAKPQTTKQH